MSVPADSPSRGRPRDPRRREAVLAAAVALIAEVGYDRMTVDALATRAGVSKPTIYRRWPRGKEDIVAEAIRAKRAAAGELPDTGSVRGDLLAMLEKIASSVEPQLAGGVLSHLRESDELTRLFRDEVVADERRRYQVLLDRAAARGEVAGPVTPLFTDIAGSVIFTRSLILGEPLDRAFLEELVDRVLLPIITKELHVDSRS
ncbi:MAG TPA: TetR/AcrR family transcriptional regulator [Solirubrobacter sp.]|nr:TetR/AcrR family transcriptional regulator [Solirubrobacter sp.]